MLQQRDIALPQWGIAAMAQHIAAIHVSMLVLLQYCRNADVACNALQHCRNTYCHNIEAHCRNAPFVASLRQCCYCKGHCGNVLWHCRNTPIFSRCSATNLWPTCPKDLHNTNPAFFVSSRYFGRGADGAPNVSDALFLCTRRRPESRRRKRVLKT